MNLTNDNFMLFCARYYNNPSCISTQEFEEDIMRFKYIKKLLTRYVENGELKERLILNHLTVLSNVFKPDVLCKIIWFKMPESLQYIKPFLMLLGVVPDYLTLNGEVINTTNIAMDQHIVNVLRKI